MGNPKKKLNIDPFAMLEKEYMEKNPPLYVEKNLENAKEREEESY